MEYKNCKSCLKDFETKNKNRVVCSIVCRNRIIAFGRRLNKYPKYLVDCAECGKAVYAKNAQFDKPNRKYCNKSCKLKHERAGVKMTQEQIERMRVRNTKHGNSNNKLWKVWSEIKRRCDPIKGKKDYGLRGITISEEWETFEVFEMWALTNGYKTGLTIERINVNGNYCKENCTWVPMSEQSKNRRPSSEWAYKNG